jgi:hypothetical protein
MQIFISRLGELMPGVSFTILANVGAGRVPVDTIPADKIPAAVDVRATWNNAAGRPVMTAEIACASAFLINNPVMSARSCADRFAPIVKGGGL